MSDAAAPKASPVAFISYAWTDEAFSERVLQLASRLCDDGVDVKIDKWDLKTGHDANVFMESMVADKSITKVIIISNEAYKLKADSRAGGAGTEAQIISPEIYKSTTQEKFGLVALQLDPDGKPFIPIFYGSRIYINLAEDVGYEEQYEQLLRWLHDKPLHKKPKIGARPKFLDDEEDGPRLATHTSYAKSLEALKGARADASSRRKEFFELCASELEKLRLVSNGSDTFDEDVLQSIELARPLISQIQDILIVAARSGGVVDTYADFADLMERVQTLCYKPEHVNSCHTWDFDNYKFIAHELYITAVAILLEHKRLKEFPEFLTRRYISVARHSSERFTHDFCDFNHNLEAINRRNQRLGLRKYSLHAEILRDRYQASSVAWSSILQADLMLYLADASNAASIPNGHPTWWPFTLVYTEDRWGPLPLFARAESEAFAQELIRALRLKSVPDFKELVARIQKERWLRWEGFFHVSIERLTNIGQLATQK